MNEPHYKVRARRLSAARAKGTHTREEWDTLLQEFDGRCVQCGDRRHLDRDHILPLYLGGSDHITNIQPLCPPCNAGKSSDSTNWAEFRRSNGFGPQGG
jgi:5-methylcytosine-specific restriction endonuclease McrA